MHADGYMKIPTRTSAILLLLLALSILTFQCRGRLHEDFYPVRAAASLARLLFRFNAADGQATRERSEQCRPMHANGYMSDFARWVSPWRAPPHLVPQCRGRLHEDFYQVALGAKYIPWDLVFQCRGRLHK